MAKVTHKFIDQGQASDHDILKVVKRAQLLCEEWVLAKEPYRKQGTPQSLKNNGKDFQQWVRQPETFGTQFPDGVGGICKPLDDTNLTHKIRFVYPAVMEEHHRIATSDFREAI